MAGAFTQFPFGNNPGTSYGLDLILAKAFPGMLLNAYQQAVEPPGSYCVVREVNGSLWYVVNADWNGSGWQQINTAQPSEALVVGATGLTFQTAPAGSPVPVVWTIENIAGAQDLGLFIPQAYGAIADGVTDDTASIQACFNAACASGLGAEVFFPTGTYKISSTINISNSNQLTIAGTGQSSEIIATSDIDMLYIGNGHTGLLIKDIQLTGSSTGGGTNPGDSVNYLGAAINIQDSITDNQFYSVFTSGTAYGMKYFAGGGRSVMYGCKFKADYVGVYMYGHGCKVIGSTINGGTYGLVVDGGADPKIFECPFFGCLSILSMNSTGSYKGGTFYIYDGEANFGPPPSTSFTLATGTVALTGGTPATGQHHTITISGDVVTCAETNGFSLAQQATADAGFINAYFSNPDNFPNGTNDNDFELVTAVGSGNGVVISATGEPGFGGNNIKYSATNSTGSITVSPTSATHFTGGSDNGLYPGDGSGGPHGAGDIVGALANSTGLTVGCGGYLIGGDHAQCNIVTNWVKDGIVFGDVDTTGPSFIDVIGGNYGASSKGKSQITNSALEFNNVGQFKVTACAISQGGSVSGAAVMIPTSAFCPAGGILNGNRFKIGSGNYAVNGTDASAEVLIYGNSFDQGLGSTATGGMVQTGGITSGPPFGTTGAWRVYDNVGFNPFGWLADVNVPANATTTITNNYGITATVSISVGAGGSVTNIALQNPNLSFRSTGQTTGIFPLPPGAQMQVTTGAAGSASTAHVFGN